ncbi:MAG: hypothetical protein LUG18_01625 [Candidatus Azobacteroides sp.]|nr:hypothetical protein [Candidatus Azobacteroides sp.]
MENLLHRLENEAGLSQQQAVESMRVMKSYLDDEGANVDWNHLFKGELEDGKEKADGFFDNLADKTRDMADKVKDKLQDWGHDAKDQAQDVASDADNYLNKNRQNP